MTTPRRVKDLADLARSASGSEFIRALGPFVLVGRPVASDRPPGWSYATRSGRGPESKNPLFDLLENHAIGLAKREGSKFPDTILIGRADSCDVVLDDQSISKLHARVHVQGYELADAQSRNGTFVDDRRLAPSDRIALRANQSIRFGDRPFRVYDPLALHRALRAIKL